MSNDVSWAHWYAFFLFHMILSSTNYLLSYQVLHVESTLAGDDATSRRRQWGMTNDKRYDVKVTTNRYNESRPRHHHCSTQPRNLWVRNKKRRQRTNDIKKPEWGQSGTSRMRTGEHGARTRPVDSKFFLFHSYYKCTNDVPVSRAPTRLRFYTMS
jgi:hypothetical protein